LKNKIVLVRPKKKSRTPMSKALRPRKIPNAGKKARKIVVMVPKRMTMK